MRTDVFLRKFVLLLAMVCVLATPTTVKAEDDEEEYESESSGETVPPPPPRKRDRKGEKRKYMIQDPSRVDAGVFHVAFAIGGNMYIEPKIDGTTKAPLGEYFKDFGFQGGVYFDYDYSELDENIPLSIRGMLGYKYVLSSVHVFAFDGAVRRMFRMSESSAFGLGIGGSAAVWYRSVTSASPDEEIIFLPSVFATAGFDFTPFMVDFKWLINRFGEDSTITGLELYFGFRL